LPKRSSSSRVARTDGEIGELAAECDHFVSPASRVVVVRVSSRWADALAVVRPVTVIARHRRGFVRFWA
jgi:hypothetical protein